ncbi:hypothetical protein PybrP1_000686 [[Pythium] brassicae (nom. inval.)]|nr:hypothetical protein PybrP1_000686 [[Pythium] brassicae (nom. inval.)]
MGAQAPQRVNVAAAAKEQLIRERDDRAYQRLVTPTQLPAPPSPHPTRHHNLIIVDSDDDDDDHDDDDDDDEDGDEDDEQEEDKRRRRRPRAGSAASTAMLHSVTQAPLERLNPRLGLSKVTNRFADERLETSYQLFSSTCDFPVARRIVLALLAFELGGLALSVVLRPQCDTAHLAAHCFTYGLDAGSVSAGYTALNWVFAPFALLYGLLPLKSFERNAGLRYGVYFVRRRWKELAALIVLLWSVGSAVTLAHTLAKLRTLFQNNVFKASSCGRNITVPRAWYDESNWHSVNRGLFLDHGMYLREWIFIYDSKVAYSVIVAVLAALGAFVGIMAVSMKLDFVHVLVVSVAQSVTTLVLVVTGPSMSLNSGIAHKITNQTVLFLLCVVMPAWVTLVATYSEDRAARSAYVSKLHAERMNTAMKLDLSVKRGGLENQPPAAGAPETEALAEALLGSDDGMALCRSVAIPFADLQLTDILAKDATGDILLARYHGTSVAVDVMQLVAFGNLRPTIPASCSPFRRQLITRCLDGDPRRRPKMAEILSMLQDEVRQELLDQNSIDSHRDKRRLLLLQRHQRLNRRGLKALMLEDDDGDSEE